MSARTSCRALGLDGFSKGWVAVLLDGNVHDIKFCRDVADALSIRFDRAAILVVELALEEARIGEREAAEQVVAQTTHQIGHGNAA